MREIHLVEFKCCEGTWPGHQLEAFRKQHEVLCRRLKAKKVILSHHFKFFLVWAPLGLREALSIPHTLWIILKSLALIHCGTKQPIRLPFSFLFFRLPSNFMHILYSMCTIWLTPTRRALERSRFSEGLGLEQGVACHPPDLY